jgi:hypothetical protein
MRCACTTLTQLRGNAGDDYAREHLEELKVDLVEWTISYRCPETGRRWLRDFPHPELQAGGPPRLRQLDADGKPTEEPGYDPFR